MYHCWSILVFDSGCTMVLYVSILVPTLLCMIDLSVKDPFLCSLVNSLFLLHVHHGQCIYCILSIHTRTSYPSWYFVSWICYYVDLCCPCLWTYTMCWLALTSRVCCSNAITLPVYRSFITNLTPCPLLTHISLFWMLTVLISWITIIHVSWYI